MCGIAGFLTARPISRDHAGNQVRKMALQMQHRGPDDSGEWLDEQHGIALGFRRLSVIDLSPAGHQPMASASGRYVIAFNGEVYNFERIRTQLSDIGYDAAFRGHSDTEVILAAIDMWGLERALQKFNGMFAFALWDRKNSTLSLARDRVGVKPLYFGWSRHTLLFASELKPLRAFAGFDDAINRGALALLLRHNYIPAPYSIYQNISKLKSGTFATFRAGQREPIQTTTYWSAAQIATHGAANLSQRSEGELVDQLDGLLRDSVKLRMVSDVPIGVFLSGGIDSSLVTALMQSQISTPVQTFTIGFNEEEYDEAKHARAIATHLGTEHHELYVTPQQALDVIPRLPRIYDEPFADSSQVPTFLVSQMASRNVTVALSGDGGDELFGGYNRYFWGRDIWKRVGWLPRWFRRGVGRALSVLSPREWDAIFSRASGLIPARMQQRRPGTKLAKLAELLPAESAHHLYRSLVSSWKSPSEIVLGSTEPITVLTDPAEYPQLNDFTDRMMYFDLMTYLPDDILVKVDRASMAVSVEAREPLLDYRLIEFAWQIPLQRKISAGRGKEILRKVLDNYVPRELIERPKMGFGIPIDRWLRGPLRDWAETLLSEERLRRDGYFEPVPIRRKWMEHLSERRNWDSDLWAILMFQAWIDEVALSPTGDE